MKQVLQGLTSRQLYEMIDIPWKMTLTDDFDKMDKVYCSVLFTKEQWICSNILKVVSFSAEQIVV